MTLANWVGFLCLIIALLILWQFRQILLLLFTATVLAIAINHLVRWLLHKFPKLKRSGAIALALALVLTGAGIFIALVVPPFVDQLGELVQLVPDGFQQLLVWADDLIENPPVWFPEIEETQIPDVTDIIQQITLIIRNVFGNFFAFFSSSAAVVLQVLLIGVLTLMFLAEPLAYRRLLLRLFPSFYRRRADEIFSLCEASLLNWMGGFALSSVFVAGMSALGLLILGIPLVLAHALLAGLANLIPNIGPTLSVVFPVAVALLNSPGKALVVVALYIVIQNLEAYWFTPLVMRQQVSLLPAAVLVAQLFFASFLGPLGLLLAIPLAVVVKIWIEETVIKDVLDSWQRGGERSPTPSPLIPAATSATEPWESSKNDTREPGRFTDFPGQNSPNVPPGAIAQDESPSDRPPAES
ncbi:MAG: AI-2E family transporter [Synechococcales bacterium]|nr:AI-2E family transporter [Synechococcales bacterium]